MKKMILLVALGLALVGPAAADTCPADIKAVDAALTTAKLSPADLKKVQDLRAAADKADKDKKPADCLKAIGEAKRLLGVK